MNNKARIISWLKEPIFTKKIDPFINFLLAFLGALISTLVYPRTEMPYWQFFLWLIPIAFLLVFVLKLIGTLWKNSRKKRDVK